MNRDELFNRIIPEPNTGCWIWGGAILWDGYGLLKSDRRQWRAHRYSWTLHFGDIPDDLFVLHKCDNPPCVNPSHLFLGNNSDNIQDSIRKGRFKIPRNGYELKTHCINGHVFSKENIYIYPNGERGCRACRNIHCVNYRLRKAMTH